MGFGEVGATTCAKGGEGEEVCGVVDVLVLRIAFCSVAIVCRINCLCASDSGVGAMVCVTAFLISK